MEINKENMSFKKVADIIQDKEKTDIEFEVDGLKVQVNDEIILQTAYMALFKIKGIVPLSNKTFTSKVANLFTDSAKTTQKGISLSKEKDNNGNEKLKLSIAISVIYGYNINDIIKEVKKEVVHSISKIVSQKIEIANINIVSIVNKTADNSTNLEVEDVEK